MGRRASTSHTRSLESPKSTSLLFTTPNPSTHITSMNFVCQGPHCGAWALYMAPHAPFLPLFASRSLSFLLQRASPTGGLGLGGAESGFTKSHAFNILGTFLAVQTLPFLFLKGDEDNVTLRDDARGFDTVDGSFLQRPSPGARRSCQRTHWLPCALHDMHVNFTSGHSKQVGRKAYFFLFLYC
jgi:hypothetical protein